MKKNIHILVSGGGTGGHIFPAVSIANALKEKMPDSEILFVGAEGRMEMERVPAAGYKIKGLPIQGFNRANKLANIKVLFRLFKSLLMARSIVKEFKPDVAVGVGGYASGAALWAASSLKVPSLIQEQNSYAGVTNKLLAKKVSKICVAYDNMERFFPADKIIKTGNPVRQNLCAQVDKELAYKEFGFDPNKKTIVVIGGSLGARTVNNSLLAGVRKLAAEQDVQVLWQTGKIYIDEMRAKTSDLPADSGVVVTDFISRMDYAYAVADLVVSRAGASSISELCLLGKPVILVPSPNVAEDHQTKNALALSTKDAAILIHDKDAVAQLVDTALLTIRDEAKLKSLSENISKLAEKDSANRIADEVIKLIK
ncbi:MAG: undecaprenyldiphospho-muramoylpentapeptide beta-N-acetylglucosaminyltransferase [Bacteroidales bacterium]|nr:undecaprenyldiphospho-muramoylpentapeptide beta-N-acetylglucosaminyltransferase [Bacteroidales bacterium]